MRSEFWSEERRKQWEMEQSAYIPRMIKIHFQGGKYGDPICGTPGAGAATTARIEDVTCDRCRKKLKKKKPALSWGAGSEEE